MEKLMRTLRTVRLLGPLGLALLAAMPSVVSAQLGSIPAEQWALVLESGRRMSSLEIENVVARINLQPGEVVADIGAGTGIFAVPLARAVSPGGVVLAVEVDGGFLPMIAEKAREEGLTNVETVLGEYQDPRLPRRDVDVAFIHDVLHHIEHREDYLRTLATYMTDGGRIVVVDYHRDHPSTPHQDDPSMLIRLEEVSEWMAAVGFQLTEEFDLFEEKFFVVYTRGG